MKVETEEAATKTMSTDPKDYFVQSSNYRFLRTHMGYPIFVTVDEGKFVTKLPGRDGVSRSSLTEIEKEIEKQGRPSRSWSRGSNRRISTPTPREGRRSGR